MHLLPLFLAPYVPTPSSRWRIRVRTALLAAGLVAATTVPPTLAAEVKMWVVVGQQGLVRFIVVPVQQAKDRSAYEYQVSQLCEPGLTCFLNFYTNSTAAAPALPLPDAIANEATATFRRSAKQGAERFMWSCRMKVASEECF
jgi:hypothetical protein